MSVSLAAVEIDFLLLFAPNSFSGQKLKETFLCAFQQEVDLVWKDTTHNNVMETQFKS